VIFIRETGSKSNPQSELVLSNYRKGGRIYLLNAKPGPYIAIASLHISTSSSYHGQNKFLTKRSLSVMLFPEEILKASMVNVKPGEFVYMGDFLLNSDNDLDKCDNFQKISHSRLTGIIKRAIPKGAKQTYLRAILNKHSSTSEKFLIKAKQDLQNTGWLPLLTGEGKHTEVKSEYTDDSRENEVASDTPAKEEEAEKPSLTCTPSVAKPAELIFVDFNAPADYPPNAWIGIIPSHIPHGSEAQNNLYVISHEYLQKRTSGTLHFTAPINPGIYDVRMNDSDDNGKEVCSTTFRVKPEKAKLIGTIADGYYISPDHSFKTKIPAALDPGGNVEDRQLLHKQGHNAFMVGFSDYSGKLFSIITFILDKDQNTTDYCRQMNETAKGLPDYAGEETIITGRGKETWITKFIKGGSFIGTRNLTAKTDAEKKSKNPDFFVTTTCFKIGNRIFQVLVGVSGEPWSKTYDKTKLLESSKESLRKFLAGIEIVGMNTAER
jgi:hypothetical protein